MSQLRPPPSPPPPPPLLLLLLLLLLPLLLHLVHWKETIALAVSKTLLHCRGRLHCSCELPPPPPPPPPPPHLPLLHLLIVYWKDTIALANKYNSAALVRKTA